MPKEPDGTPDATASYIRVDETDYPASITLSARIGNGGAVSLPAGTGASFYNGDPSQGGVLIGTSSTSTSLDNGSYEDVYVIWNSPDSGIQEIFAIADADNEIDECREDNNSASAVFDTGSGAQVPRADLELSASGITLTPGSPVEGQPVLISAEIHNIGDEGASGVAVSFYNGDPDVGGSLIGSDILDSVESGLSSVAEVLWDTMGQRGINFIHVVVDPGDLIEERNENNNSSLIQADVSFPTHPDLSITSGDITISNQSPTEGETIELTVTVHNLGVNTGNVTAALYDGEPENGGALLETYTIAPAIQFDGQSDAVFSIDTTDNAGGHVYFIVVDPDNTIIEENEDNNSASAVVNINSAGIGLSVMTDKSGYFENEDMQIAVTVSDLLGRTRQISVEVRILDASGTLAEEVAARSITISPLETQTIHFTWNTGFAVIGDYIVRSVVYDQDSPSVAVRSVPVGILSSAGITTNLAMDKTAYSANETVTMTSTITNGSVNSVYGNITANIAVYDTSGQTLLSENRTIGLLTPSSHYSFNTYLNTSSNIPGTYPVTLEARDSGGNVLSVSTANITINSGIRPSRLLQGEIFVTTQSILQGQPAIINYSVTNTGNIELEQVDLSIMSVHVTDLTVYDTLTDQVSLLVSETFNNVQLLDTQNYSAMDYLIILRATVSGTSDTLASTYLRLEGAPSAPSLSWPIHGEDVETLLPALIVNNASDPNEDELTYEFELYADGGLTALVSSENGISEGENTTEWEVPFELTENEVYVWRVRAHDGMLHGEWMPPAVFRVNVENDAPASPTLSSPLNGTSVDMYRPVLIINNAVDPDSGELVYNFELSTDEDFSGIIASETGITSGVGTTDWHVPVDLEEDTYYYWRAQADDWLTEGPWMETARFLVDTENNAPSAPQITAPQEGVEIQTLDVEILAEGAADPESAPLAYQFEMDTIVTFESQDLMYSGYIYEGASVTAWNVSGLLDNTMYYVRVNANDGVIDGPWSTAVRFFVNTMNDMPGSPVLANPSEGGAVNLHNPVLSVHNAADIDGDELTYEFELYDTESMSNLVARASGVTETEQTTSWTVPSLLVENESYYWRVRAYDGELCSEWMTLASFILNTANDAPGAPALYAPGDGSGLETLTPLLEFINANDPDNDSLTYNVEIYIGDTLISIYTGIPESPPGITSFTVETPLQDNTTYSWRARAYDGDRYGAWMDAATFSIHIPANSITATIDFRPRTLNKASSGNWTVAFIELPSGHDVHDIDRSSILLENSIHAIPWPYRIGDHDRDGKQDLMVKFRRSEVIEVLPEGEEVPVTITGMVGTTAFEGVDSIRVLPAPQWRDHPPHKRCKGGHYWKRQRR